MTNDKINHHLAEVVWVPTTGEEPISDEATAGTEDKVLLPKWKIKMEHLAKKTPQSYRTFTATVSLQHIRKDP